tara:strand:+ start:166 stop:375 length:210 start_codon:yes stop_codon:yes gene_type:complete
MDKETYLNIADLMTIRLAIADKLATEYLKEYEQESRVEALERVQDRIREMLYQRRDDVKRVINVELKMK